MFVLLKTVPPEKRGFFARIARVIRPKKPIVCRREVMDTYYMEITAVSDRRGINWADIRRAAGAESGRIILPRGIVPPRGSGIAGYDASGFLRRITVNGAVAVCEAAAQMGAGFSVMLLDREANCPFAVARLIKSADTVYIVTARTREYSDYADRIFDMTGARPVVSDSCGPARECKVMIAPYGFAGFSAIEPRPVSFTCSERCGVYLNSDTASFGKYERCVPEGYVSAEFLAALCERAHVSELRELIPDSFFDGIRSLSISDLANKICCFCGQKAKKA